MNISKLEYVKLQLQIIVGPECWSIKDAKAQVDQILELNGIEVADEAAAEIRPLTAEEFRNILFTNSHSGIGLTNELIKRGLVV